ncbi:UDP-glucose 4-epimerase GalE [Aureibaculum marinum]|uniref:UDP-glucose 4-epimerase n=1 Tax=Aureibaculum marinum TaxID=2487930 RepID=A0A3N4NZ14_9FLAO|nr:UDP-glucose 4-epimerase GalE [Aureibaculum marinum]RPD97500.1 UDP-glucose 4-epimerase GalE [Aureibaculum marinum]
MSKILVTGGLGFIGSHTVVELQNEGFEVVIIDNLSNTTIDVLDKITSITGKEPLFEKLDLKNQPSIQEFFKKHQDVEGVIHFAASKAVGESVEKPLMYYHNNISTLIYLLEEMRTNKVNNFIFSSSCTVYGQADQMPITESAPFKTAESPYGNTKQIGEEIIADTSKVSDLKAIALRYFNPIGAHETAKIGELPIGVPQNLIPYVTQTAAGIREQLSVFGGDYPTPDGTAIRDYIHVVDLAKAHTVAMKRLLNGENNSDFEVFNIGTGKGSSVLDVIKAFENATDQKLNYKIVDRREGDITEAYADTTYAQNELKWKAELSLDDALASAWKWQKTLK